MPAPRVLAAGTPSALRPRQSPASPLEGTPVTVPARGFKPLLLSPRDHFHFPASAITWERPAPQSFPGLPQLQTRPLPRPQRLHLAPAEGCPAPLPTSVHRRLSRDPVKMQFLTWVLGWGPSGCISDEPPGTADAAGPRTKL